MKQAESHPLGEGKPLEKEKGTPLKRIPFAVEGGWGAPCGESHPLGEEGHLDRVDSSMKRILFALEKGTPMVQSPFLGIWCCEGDLLDANRIWGCEGDCRENSSV